MPAENPSPTSVFDTAALPASKTDPALVATDERHLTAIAAGIAAQVADLSRRLDDARRSSGGHGTAALERDQEIHRLSSRLRTLRRFGVDLCLGRMVPSGGGDGSPPVYVGRAGLSGPGGERLLVDWRSPAAEPFFGATHADPMGLLSRRRYRWTRGRVTDFWDEVFTADGLDDPVALDDRSAFVAGLGRRRGDRMQDVLGTIQADQDAVIRAGSRGALVVHGGPGTGKTVVALHRAAYLLYADPQLGQGHGGVLVVGPHQPYLDYVADVLPGLGEEGVQTATLRDLLPEGAGALAEPDAEVARVKGSVAMVGAVETAVRFYEDPPTEAALVETPWGEARISVAAWVEAFAEAEPGTPHHEGREQVWDALVEMVVDQHEDDVPADRLRRWLQQDGGLSRALDRAWPVLDPAELVADLWSVPAFLRLCAPWLTPVEVRLLQRPPRSAWTVPDLPLLDAARRRLGDPGAGRRRRRDLARAVERERVADVVEDLIEHDDSEMKLMSMLRGEDLQGALLDTGQPAADRDVLAGPFAHVVVDEAQELTDAEWQMLLQRCPSRSLTVVGDRAQARRGFAEPWQERLQRVGLTDVRTASLRVGYRTPHEVMVEAEPVIRAVLPDAEVPTSVRSTGIPVRHGSVAELDEVLRTWLATHADGVACVIGDPGFDAEPWGPRIRSLTPELAKGLELDLVVLVDPDRWGTGVQGAVDRYVAMTRATSELVVLTSG